MKASYGILVAIFALFSKGALMAQSLVPTPLTGESRLVTFEYDEDRIYKVLMRPKNLTQLKFGPDEKVVYADAGDKTSFNLTVPQSKLFVEVRPKWENVTTNLLVVTNKRTYHIELQSTAEGKKWYARVAWQYEDAALVDATSANAGTAGRSKQAGDPLLGVNVERMDDRYQIDGDAAFRPTRIFDDGTHTWIRMPERLQQLPALMMEAADSEDRQLVDYAVTQPKPDAPHRYLVVPRVMERFVLVHGKSLVRVVKGESSGKPRVAARSTYADARGDN